MLDYRAHKLLWLLCLPYSLASTMCFYAFVIVVSLVVHSQLAHLHPALQILIAWAVVEIPGGLAFGIVNWIATSLIHRVFFWLIDVVPAHGATPEEAKAVVLQGPAYTLNAKFDSRIDEWTDEDSQAYIALMNWRSRWCFPVKARVAHMVEELQRIYRQENLQPGQLPKKTIESIATSVPGGKPTLLEKLFINPISFYAAVRLGLVVLVVAVAN